MSGKFQLSKSLRRMSVTSRCEKFVVRPSARWKFVACFCAELRTSLRRPNYEHCLFHRVANVGGRQSRFGKTAEACWSGGHVQTEDSLCYPTASSLWKKKRCTHQTVVPIAAQQTAKVMLHSARPAVLASILRCFCRPSRLARASQARRSPVDL